MCRTVFVNSGGDWKISGLEYVSSVDQDSPIKVIRRGVRGGYPFFLTDNFKI